MSKELSHSQSNEPPPTDEVFNTAAQVRARAYTVPLASTVKKNNPLTPEVEKELKEALWYEAITNFCNLNAPTAAHPLDTQVSLLGQDNSLPAPRRKTLSEMMDFNDEPDANL